MPVSRRAALKTIGVAGGLTAASGTVFARGEHKDDERPTDGGKGSTEDDHEGRRKAPKAAVRVAHFSPDAPNVDVYVEGDRVLADVAYGDVSPYLEIAPGTYQVTITAADDPDTVAFDDQVTFGSAIYTVAAIGELEPGTFRPKVLVDAGSALVRAVHASPDAPAVDIYAGEDPLFENLAFGEETEYLAVPAGDYSLSIRPAGEPDAVASFDVSLEAGTAYSGYAIGYLNPPEGATGRDFTVELTVDGAMADE
ncbi:hypothetical protein CHINAEXTREME_03635 [Halobiforma lacisalsi AJ5]|uniref:DUF4397 domain-containing protein n=1 Tax=Natronobacterium lacisalsi AJ5 TaxID=358396 RepID=M0LRE7_NATLA|nr:DUF4397 domain-containing protein [Halobiforma lacisalsi]APW96915.1 hypothetical protein CHINAEXTREME_03635 [Halobiforma lacisalsi AJ5]EMA34625.1 hypothetical protein C445_06875 [Halobiforma lacisalsi AJ5]